MESYLRYLQTLGKSPSYPMSVRGFSLHELDLMAPRDSAHPWAQRYSLNATPTQQHRWDYVRPTAEFTFNSAFPYGSNDGAVWKGKGITSSVVAGVSARWSGLSVVLAPTLFRAENAAFPLMKHQNTSEGEFADGPFPQIIDLPQRFGDTPYQRIDWGESTIRLDAHGMALGVSTASEWWGPTNDFPFVLGNNAGGFPHVLFGTSEPVNVGVGKMHGRVIYGLIDQSAFSPVTGPTYVTDSLNLGTRRFAAGLVAVLQVRGVPGLEIGGARFFHAGYKRGGITAQRFSLPFQQLLKGRVNAVVDSSLGSPDAGENQLASLFFRWSPPGSGSDIYGEFGRDDHSQDIRDFLFEPEHASGLNIGFRHAWMSGTNITAVRAEAFEYGEARSEGDRFEGFIYTHAFLRQGHTSRGQLLAADVGPGSGSAQIIALDRFSTVGRSTLYFRRVVQHEKNGELIGIEPGTVKKPVDVLNSLGWEMSRFVGKVDITVKAALTFDLNRYFLSDQTNATVGIAARQSF
ncbi:MAG: capsule assembly Wzi family protein [Gemmatimonadales bacterium]